MTNELPLGSAVLKLTLDSSAIQSGMYAEEQRVRSDIQKMAADASNATRPLTAQLQNVEKASGGATTGLGKLSSGMGLSTGQLIKGAAAAAGFYVGILGVSQVLGRGLHDALAGGIADARAYNEIQAQTAAVLKSTGNAAGLTQKDIVDIGNAFEKTTKFGNDQVQSMENVLLTFTKINKDVFPQTTGLILDISQALGQDLQQTAIQVGKALNDPAVGMANLQRIGVSFTKEQIDQAKAMEAAGNMAGAQSIILGELTREFGGSATAAEEAAGGVDVARNRMLDARREIAEKLLPATMSLQAGFYGDAAAALEAASNSRTLAMAADALKTTLQGAGDAAGALDDALIAIKNIGAISVAIEITLKGLDVKVPGTPLHVAQILAMVANPAAFAMWALGKNTNDAAAAAGRLQVHSVGADAASRQLIDAGSTPGWTGPTEGDSHDPLLQMERVFNASAHTTAALAGVSAALDGGGSGGSGGGLAGAAKTAEDVLKQAIDDATSANRPLHDALAGIASSFQQEQIDALLKGGISAVTAVKATQAQEYAAIHTTAEQIQMTLGVDVPTALKAAFASVTDAAKAAQQAADDAAKAARDAQAEHDKLFGSALAANNAAAKAEFGAGGVGYSISLLGGHVGVGGAAASVADAYMRAMNALSGSLGRGLTAAEQQSVVDQLLLTSIPKRALGGPVTAGQPYLVGELRPEVFVPDRNGTIAPDIASVGGSGRGGDTYYVLHAHGPIGSKRELQNWFVGMQRVATRQGRSR